MLAGTETFYDDEGRLDVRAAGAFGAADGSTFSRYSEGLVELSNAAADLDGDEYVEPAGPDAAELTAQFVAMLGS